MPLSPPERSASPRAATRSRRTLRLAAGQDKRDTILRAATRVFARRGFFNAQVADVARVAGVAAGTVYLYFRSKDDLLASIFDKTMREAIDEGQAALTDIVDPVARLREIARLHLDRMGRDREMAVVFQVELRQSVKYMERFSSTLFQDYLHIIRDTIAQGQADGAFRGDISPTVAAKILFGALDEMATNWILSKRTYSLVSKADTVVDVFLNGVRRSDPAGTKQSASGRRPPKTGPGT